jgi:hypothetical protein
MKTPLPKMLKYEKFELFNVESFRNLRLIRIDYWHVFHLNKNLLQLEMFHLANNMALRFGGK